MLFIAVHAGAQEKPGEPFLYKSFTARQNLVQEVDPIDVLHYDVALSLDFQRKQIQGLATTDISLTDAGADYFYIHLTQLEVSSASINGIETTFQREADKIYFQHPPADSIFQLKIVYSGAPTNDGFGGFFFNGDYAYTIGEGINSYPPSMLRTWIPSHDVPDDKATLDLHITIPQELSAFSNGTLLSTRTNGDSTKTVFWRENHPIATYLVAIAVGPYETFSIPYVSVSGAELPLQFYVFPEHYDIAREDWKNITQMMRFFENHFSPYPFDRYSMAEAANRGAMEHQTMTTWSSQLITGDHRYDYIVAHELAHHWWGDLVTLGDWRDIWLNEGFATYCEALYFESLNGAVYLQDYMENLAAAYYKETARLGHFAIYDPDYLWGGTVYQKGAWVLHMLRWTIGEDAFWRTLQSYARTFAYSNAVTPDFIKIAETESGQKLDWFFDQWIYKPGYPDLDISWNFQQLENAKYRVKIDIEQKQWDKFQFVLPVEVALETVAGKKLDTLQIAERKNSFTIETDSQPVSLQFDPHNWLLKQDDIVSGPQPPGSAPGDFFLAQNYTNPFSVGQVSNFLYYVTQLNAPHFVSLKIFNVLGQEVRTLVNQQKQGGFYIVQWDGYDDNGKALPVGIYFYRLLSNNHQLLKKTVLINQQR